jgi:hypothetical protein
MKDQKSNIKYQISFLICYLLYVICFMFVPQVHAQSLSLSLTPPLLEVMIKPGKSITQVFRLTNEGEPVFITPRLVEYTENGIKENERFAPEPWINFLPGSLSLNQPFLLHTGETRGLVLRVAPPAGLPDANIYRVLLFESQPNPSDPSDSESMIQSKIGSILLLNVTTSGITKKDAQISRFELPNLIDSFDPLRAEIHVKNTGTTYFRPIGQISLQGPVGKGIYKIEPAVWLAGQTRILNTSPEDQNVPYSLNLPGFYLGKYEVVVEFTLDESTIKLSQKKTFYALPWKIAVCLLIIILFVILIRRRRKKKSNIQKDVIPA